MMYLQTSRYILKNYKNFALKKKSAGNSVKYVERLNEILNLKVSKDNGWNLEDVEAFLAQSVSYLLNLISLQTVEKAKEITQS